jgi:hypothetical protein
MGIVKRYGRLWARNTTNIERLRALRGHRKGVYVLCDGSICRYTLEEAIFGDEFRDIRRAKPDAISGIIFRGSLFEMNPMQGKLRLSCFACFRFMCVVSIGKPRRLRTQDTERNRRITNQTPSSARDLELQGSGDNEPRPYPGASGKMWMEAGGSSASQSFCWASFIF